MISRRSYASRPETNFPNSPFNQHPARQAVQCEADRDQLTALLKGRENAERRYALEAEFPTYDLQGVGEELGLAGPGGRESPGGFAQELAEQIAGGSASLTPRLGRFLADHIDLLLDFFYGFVKAAGGRSIPAESQVKLLAKDGFPRLGKLV